nr:ubiquitin-like protein Pup [Angustibacter aerolatus]
MLDEIDEVLEANAEDFVRLCAERGSMTGMTPSERKGCPRCAGDLPLSDFGRNSSRPDGLAEFCRPCFREIRAASYRRRRAAEGKTVREARVAPAGTQWCPDCKDFRPLTDFGANRSTASGLAAYCKPHQRDRVTESRRRVHGGSRHYHLKRRYGISAEQADQTLEAQARHVPDLPPFAR